MNELKKVVIFGATSAIAEHAARDLIDRGASLFCVGRDQGKLEVIVTNLKIRNATSQRIEGYVADLMDTEGHSQILKVAEETLGGIDAALICYGTLPDQKKCESSFAVAREAIDVNAISVVSLLTELANKFESQKRGVIAVVSSVAGDRGRQSNYVYGAAKGMVSIFMQGLRNRLAKHGVSVVTIKPGFVDTPMTEGFDKSGILWTKPEKISKGLVNAMESGKSCVYLPGFWRWIMLLIRCIPEGLFKRLSL